MFRALTVLLIFLLPGPGSFGQAGPSDPRLKNGQLKAEYSLLSRKITHPLWQSALYADQYFILVQMEQRAGPATKENLNNRGIRLVQWVSGNNWLAVCKPGFTIKDREHNGIKNMYAIPATMKMDARLKDKDYKPAGKYDLVAVTLFPSEKNDFENAIRASGATIVETKLKPANTIFVRASGNTIDKLAALPFVSSLSPIHLEDKPLNYNSRAVHSVQALSATVGRNLSGKGLVVGIGDNANPTGHVDLAGKLILRTDQPIDVHGTHTSGIIAGGGIADPMFTGMAPRSRLVVNDFSNILVNAPTYVADFNMVLTNNSYYNGDVGCIGDGDYNMLSSFVDDQELSFPKLLDVFAAGNDASFTCLAYPKSFGTIKSGFQTGKNIMTIGSMYNGNYTIGGNSSRGPANDGRIKPELVACGVNVTSTVPNNAYASITGTSQASPTAAGIMALFVERYRQLHGGAYPDGALIKTLATNNAVDLGNPGPDYTFGFGMISGRPAIEALEQNRYFVDSLSDSTNKIFTVPSIPSGGYQLKVMLYWPDVPAAPLSLYALVNDLDLTVTDPLGTVHLPMVLDTNAANVNNNASEGTDHINNIEQVTVNNPPPGNYSLKVSAWNIPAGPQNFYLTYTLLPNSVTLEYPFGAETWVPGQIENIRWSAYGGEPNSFTLEYSIDGGSSWTTIDNAIPASARTYAWTVPAVATTQALMRITRNVAGYTDVSDYNFTILGQPTLTVTNTCPGYALLQWGSIPGASSYDVLKLSGDTMAVIGHTTDTSWLATPLAMDSSYWFSVRGVSGSTYGRRSSGQNIIPNSGACTAPGLDNDLMIDSLAVPSTGRQFTSSQLGNQRISIRVRNAGNIASASPVSYSYQVNGGPVVTEVSATVVPAHGNLIFTFSPANSYDFSSVGAYDIKTWIHYAADTIPANDTLLSHIKNLRNDPLVLSPSYTEGFESATNQTYNTGRMGLDSLDRADFFNSNTNGRLSTFFNTGFARTGIRSMLLDVTVQGTSAADSLTNTFNLSNYSTTDQIWLDIYFKKQSVVAPAPGNMIWIRGNDQAAWIPVKSLNDPVDQPGAYIKFNLDVTGTLAAAIPAQTISSSFQVRCGTEGKIPGTSSNDGALQGGGISFDDFMLTNALHDVGMRTLLQPVLKNICGLSATETISVLVRNYSTDTLRNIPVSYEINQAIVTESIPVLLPGDSLQYNFHQTADLSDYQLYHIKTWVSSPTDNYRNNDSSADYTVQTTPLVSQYPYLEGFEGNNGYWYTNGQNDSWQWGKPAKQIIHKAANGANAWVTSLTGNYNDNEYSFLYSPCFDLTSLTKPVLSFSHIFRTEDNCMCDYHWVEYSLDDSTWTLLGSAKTGVNWYDDTLTKTWQVSNPRWHVSSIDIPVVVSKIRFRFVMYSDPGTNYEGVGIDDVHIFEKAPVFTDSLQTTLGHPVSGSNWIDFEQNGKKIFSINPAGQNLGNMTATVYRDTAAIRDTALQYYGGTNWVIKTAQQPSADIHVRYYFTDSEANKMILANSCDSCPNIEDAYSIGITQYSSPVQAEEDSTLRNNLHGTSIYHKPQTTTQIIPYDNGYYAETAVKRFSEFWLNGGGKNQDHPLAAWLKDFTAVLVNTTGLLNWTSWQDLGSVKYIIEKSSDSAAFHKIGELNPLAFNDSTNGYQFTDNGLQEGNNYYRIVVYLNNGDSLVSPVRKVFYAPIPTTVQVYPNPTLSDITIKTPSPCREIQIFDVLGRKLLEKAVQGYTQQISLARLPMGVYFLKLFTDSGNKLIKLEKR